MVQPCFAPPVLYIAHLFTSTKKHVNTSPVVSLVIVAVLVLIYLQNNGRSRLELLHSRCTERLEYGVGVIQEVDVLESQHSLHVVEDEAKLVRFLHHLLLPAQATGQCWGLAQHRGGTEHLAKLYRTHTRRTSASRCGLMYRLAVRSILLVDYLIYEVYCMEHIL